MIAALIVLVLLAFMAIGHQANKIEALTSLVVALNNTKQDRPELAESDEAVLDLEAAALSHSFIYTDSER